MDADFWIERWASNNIAFHNEEANAFLVRHVDSLGLSAGDRVFVPLCGKTRDIAWLLAQGYRVAGVELVRDAVEQLFADLGVAPARSAEGAMERFSAKGLDIFVGDIFDLSAGSAGPVDAVYDRAALVALPAEMRTRYTRRLLELAPSAPQLLVTYVYDQSLKAGPPFSIDKSEVASHYDASHDLTLLDSEPMEGGLDGACDAVREAWLITPR
ncbi:thiopurine S-methyltransferase [Marinihelvus fidelis]|uniref:Thiopurine S-methyltransferase n=1 Tax=Marinihelvus fidelis TaxID=2613842 RepID=A0A5N0TI36_9GAMM|nr:thiopurine S-methyltransferase [Marinihelvus fidelis]KAA9134148.1 thiopurine S-methyltransferase [Marinihelvus fidelis]